MPSIFTKIIAGDIPGRFVWKDDKCVAMLTIAPLRPGHVLVIPREEVDHWLDLEAGLACHLFRTSQVIGRAIHAAFGGKKVGLSIVGLEVRHVHLHLVPINGIADMTFGKEQQADGADLDDAAEKIRSELKKLGYSDRTA